MSSPTPIPNAAGSGSKHDVTADDLAKQIETLRSDLETLTHSVGAAVSERASSAAGKARQMRDDLSLEAQVRLEDAGRKASSLHADAEAAVVRNPTLAIGVATGVGFLVGLVMARR